MRYNGAMKPVKKTSYHHGNLRESIINAVAQLIKEKRGLNFQLKEVAELVGTSQPAIYKHFDSKKALLTEVAVAGYQLQAKLRDKALESIKGSPLAKMKAIGRSYMDFAQNYPGYFLLIKNLETKEILSSKRYLAVRKKTIDVIHSTTIQCMDEGLFVQMDLQLAVTTLNAAVYGLAHLYITNQMSMISTKEISTHDFLEMVIDLHIKSLLSEKGQIEFEKIK
jgi:AcrR family transcriptional regulator